MQKILQIAIPVVVGIVFFVWSGAGRAIECGPDEGMEFAKALLVARDPGELVKCWNDQPWFSSLVCAKLYALCNFKPWGVRMVTLGICAVMCGVLRRLMPRGSGWPHLLFSWLFLWSWPYFSQLCVAAMIDLPAFCLAVIASTVLPRKHEEWRAWRFGVSGILFALAVQVKLTSLLVLPAAIAQTLVVGFDVYRDVRSTRSAKNSTISHIPWLPPLLCFGAFTVTFALIVMASPDWDLKYLLAES